MTTTRSDRLNALAGQLWDQSYVAYELWKETGDRFLQQLSEDLTSAANRILAKIEHLPENNAENN